MTEDDFYLNTNAHLEAKATTLERVLAESQARELRMREVLQGWQETAANCTIESGCCCCGEDMARHSSPMYAGHSPVDMADQVVSELVKKADAALALPSDDSALRELIEAEREACAAECESIDPEADEWSDPEERAESRMAKNCAAAI